MCVSVCLLQCGAVSHSRSSGVQYNVRELVTYAVIDQKYDIADDSWKLGKLRPSGEEKGREGRGEGEEGVAAGYFSCS